MELGTWGLGDLGKWGRRDSEGLGDMETLKYNF